MEKANFGQIVSFLFGIANDCLVDTYDVGDYRKIILPMMVIRRFDAVLEPTKEKVLKMKEQLDAAGITDQDEALCIVAGEAFCNSSPYTLSDLKSRTNQQQLKSDFILYLNGFSQNVQDIIKRFEFRNQIDKLSEHDILGLLISKFTLVIWLTSKPASNRTRAKRNSKTLPINGRFSRIPMKPLLTKKPSLVCRNFARTNADPPEQARPICSPVSFAVPIVVRNCTTAPATVLKPDKITSYAPLLVKRARRSATLTSSEPWCWKKVHSNT